MKLLFSWVLALVLLPAWTSAVRCYQCDATDECRTVPDEVSSTSYVDAAASNVEVVDCEHYCWKSVSLGRETRTSVDENHSSFFLSRRQCLSRLWQEALRRLAYDGRVLKQRLLRH